MLGAIFAGPMKSPAKSRLDCLLVERGLFSSREKAQRAILAGDVMADGQRADKPGTQYPNDLAIEIKKKERYVSRGGTKLEAALQRFDLDPTGRVCLDIGASTGGFTDCLLQHGATRVYALDVGHGQMDWRIRNDPRVVVREKINARYLAAGDLPEPVSLCVIDVSFIALTSILPAAPRMFGHPLPIVADIPCATMVALIKPQFELERGDVGRGGIVREPALHAQAVEKVRRFVGLNLTDWRWTGVVDSPILGTEGNKEFLACLQK